MPIRVAERRAPTRQPISVAHRDRPRRRSRAQRRRRAARAPRRAARRASRRSAATGGAATSAMRENTPRSRRIALPSAERLKKLPHSPRSAIGTTGTGVSLDDPLDAGPERLDLAVSASACPRGRCRRARRRASAAAASSNARSFSAASSLRRRDRDRAHRAEHAQSSSGMRKMRWSITKRIGRRHARGDDQRVDVAHVVADDDAGPFVGNVARGPPCRTR